MGVYFQHKLLTNNSIEDLLSEMVVPEGYDRPLLDIILRSNKPDNTTDVIQKLMANIKKQDGGKVALFLKD